MIRPATKDDIPFIIRSLQAMREECALVDLPDNDPEYVSEQLEILFDTPGFVGFVYGEQHGYMFGTIAPMWFCSKLRAYELSLYVKPEHRGCPAAIRLIKQFMRTAEDAGAVEVLAGSYTEIKVEKLYKLYERLGFVRHGLGLRYRIASGN